MEHRLGIVVPAFKERFLARTLNSIASQTDQRFNLYVFDDHSPAPIETLARSARLKQLNYHRFDENLGSKSLARNWNRCVQQVEEPWVWLFSDDDIMEPACVQRFYAALDSSAPKTAVYRFNTVIIDAEDRPIRLNPPHPPFESWMQFAYFLLSGSRQSTAQEAIFSKQAWERQGGFVDFPLAWGSDHANTIALGAERGIATLEGPRVRFRQSGENISSRRAGKDLEPKLEATQLFVSWLLEFSKAHPDPEFCLGPQALREVTRQWFFSHLEACHALYGPKLAMKLSRFASRTWGGPLWLNFGRVTKTHAGSLAHFCRTKLKGRSATG